MLNLFCMSVPVLATAAEAPSAFKFWAAAAIFVITFVVIATEKIHKTACVLVGSALMRLFVTGGKSGNHQGRKKIRRS